MEQQFAGLGVLFVAGFGPITQQAEHSKAFYADALGLPLKPMDGNADYLLTEHGALEGLNISPCGHWRRPHSRALVVSNGRPIYRYPRRGWSLTSLIWRWRRRG